MPQAPWTPGVAVDWDLRQVAYLVKFPSLANGTSGLSEPTGKRLLRMSLLLLCLCCVSFFVQLGRISKLDPLHPTVWAV